MLQLWQDLAGELCSHLDFIRGRRVSTAVRYRRGARGMRTVMTPLGWATLIGLSPDRSRACCMHTRPKDEWAPKISRTYSRWWGWDGEKCIEEQNETGSA